MKRPSRTSIILEVTSEGIVKGRGCNGQSLEERWDLVDFKNMMSTPWQLTEPRAVVARQPHSCRRSGCTSSGHSPKKRNELLKRKLSVLGGDVERLGATDGCVACTKRILCNRATVTHSATCTRRMQELMEKEDVGRVRFEMRSLRQPYEVVAEQLPAGVESSRLILMGRYSVDSSG